jgi:hypothetical protein
MGEAVAGQQPWRGSIGAHTHNETGYAAKIRLSYETKDCNYSVE